MFRQLFGNKARESGPPPTEGGAALQKINQYGRQLTAEEIAAGKHRSFVGGMWDEIGALQFEFLKTQGLSPTHLLVDVGCGALRGGIYFVRYLEPGNYHGIDINESLIEAAKTELAKENLTTKEPHLLVDQNFQLSRFGVSFDYAIAVSIFTHLFLNHIVRCLVEVRKALKPDGKFFATFFESPASAHLADLEHDPGKIVTHFDRDPFHYSFEEMTWAAQMAGLDATLIGDWSHPRAQRMLCFSQRSLS